MTRRRNRFGTVLVVAIAVGLLATVVGAGAVAAVQSQSTVEDQTITENASTVENESINEVEQESFEGTEQDAEEGPQIEPPEDVPIESPDEVESPTEPVESPEMPDEPVTVPDDPFAGAPEWVSGLF
ncbi:hypothetical protein [Natrinema amylolyticum]|uniref:hypothetical protein n=1 Tax=Natrinema amylolyticum TaxID=2878679 RepID=UPI001CFB132A|nr:hypothetical protein [Natrinema amylolyticum]